MTTPTVVPAPQKVATTATTNAALAPGRHTPVDASGAARTMTLPTGVGEGRQITVEKIDSSANTVTITGSIRGAAGSVALTTQYHTISFVADSDGSWHPVSDHRTQAALNSAFDRISRINVKTYGAKGDGTTDDTAVIQNAIDAATAAVTAGAGAIEVYFPAGVYRLNSSTTASGLRWCISVVSDHVKLVGDGDASVLRCDVATAAIVWFGGSGKPQGPTNHLKYVPWRYSGDMFANGTAITPTSPNLLLPITGGTRGATTVTLTTPADAASLAAGDDVVVRSGQLVLNAGNWNAEPDCEYNVVVSANATTGVVVLERPLAKPYVQEYQSAVAQISTTTPGGSSAPLALVKITGAVQRNTGMKHLKLVSLVSTTAPVIIRGVVDGYHEEDITFDCLGVAHDSMEFRNFIFRDLRVTMRGTHRGDLWPVAAAVGCTDGLIENIRGWATNKVCTLHIHEGASRIKVRGVTLASGGVGNSNYEISIRSRAYDVQIDDYTITGANTHNAIIIGQDCTGGGRIGKGIIRKPSATGRSILMQCTGWEVERPDDTRGGDLQIDPVVRATQRPLGMHVLAGWLSDDVQTVTLGEMPAQSIVVSAGIHVYETFNSDGNDLAHIGWDSNNTAVVSSIDVSSGFNRSVPVGAAMGYMDTARTLKAYYVNGGSEPTTGKALVWVVLSPAPTHVA